MGDSDGETNTNRHFINIRDEDVSSKIVNTGEFQKFCHNLSYVHRDICITEFKRDINNDDTFKAYLQIPKKTIIEVNAYNDETDFVVHFLFECNSKTKNSHEVKFYLKEELAKKCAENYVKFLATTGIQQQHNIDEGMNEIIVQNATSVRSKNLNEVDLNQKIDKLIEQVNNLTKLLAEQQEENARLKEELKKLNGERSERPHKKRRRENHNMNPTAKTANDEFSDFTDDEMQYLEESNKTAPQEKITPKKHPIVNTTHNTQTSPIESASNAKTTKQ
ncbi:uncharacterized protein R10E11.5-like, partial [Contarinia nasturtii]|uniref:uncharacterized protein R10E11.5-like n=1 Tax=Contarinia nasturtii TaxID=265458 RepID=UPI0012D3AF09